MAAINENVFCGSAGPITRRTKLLPNKSRDLSSSMDRYIPIRRPQLRKTLFDMCPMGPPGIPPHTPVEKPHREDSCSQKEEILFAQENFYNKLLKEQCVNYEISKLSGRSRSRSRSRGTRNYFGPLKFGLGEYTDQFALGQNFWARNRGPPASSTLSRNEIKCMDAPGLVSDFYLNLVDWSNSGSVCVGLNDSVCLWKEPDGLIEEIGKIANDDPNITSVKFDREYGNFLSMGKGPKLDVWDCQEESLVRNFTIASAIPSRNSS